MSADTEAIKAYLTGAGLGDGATGWRINCLNSQDSPDREITISETGGPTPEEDTARTWRRPTFQIAVRAERDNVKSANDQAWAILLGLHRATTVAGLSLMFAQQSTPFNIGRDPMGRPRFTVNFRAGEA